MDGVARCIVVFWSHLYRTGNLSRLQELFPDFAELVLADVPSVVTFILSARTAHVVSAIHRCVTAEESLLLLLLLLRVRVFVAPAQVAKVLEVHGGGKALEDRIGQDDLAAFRCVFLVNLSEPIALLAAQQVPAQEPSEEPAMVLG